jgi:hypothetical protein
LDGSGGHLLGSNACSIVRPEPPSVLDALVAPADVAAWATIASPGPDAVAPLAAIDPARIDGAGRIDLLVGLERQIAWLQACQQRVLAALDGEALSWAGQESIDFTQEQVGAALRLSPGTAANRLAVARTLNVRLPGTVERLSRGEVTYLQAKKLAEAVTPFDDATCGVIEDKVLRRAAEQTLSQFTATLHRAVLAADPRSAEQRHADALAERRVVIIPADDGMTELWALLPAEGAAMIGCVLDALAVKMPGEVRSADQRRADAMVDVFARVIADSNLPEQHGARPSVQVTVAASTLLGCDEQPGELTGYGPITANQARRIAADHSGTWRRLLTDPTTGALLDYGRTTYRPPRDLADFVIARDRTCIFPTCQRNARRCDLDHGQPFDAGGTTCPHNLHPLCRRHHRAKHHAGWTVAHQPDGTYRWTSPTGHHYTVQPHALPTRRRIAESGIRIGRCQLSSIAATVIRRAQSRRQARPR